MTDARKKTLLKIKKLLALGRSPHPHEAASALAKARELMDAHGVDEGDVAAADVAERVAEFAGAPATPPLWLTALGSTVALAFGVKKYYWPGRGYAFVGVGPAADVAEYAFDVLRRQLVRDRSAYYGSLRGRRANKIRRADDYALGWVVAVRATVERFARPVPEAVGAYLAKSGAELAEFKPRDRGRDRDSRHARAGWAAGQGVDLQNAVPTSAPDQLT